MRKCFKCASGYLRKYLLKCVSVQLLPQVRKCASICANALMCKYLDECPMQVLAQVCKYMRKCASACVGTCPSAQVCRYVSVQVHVRVCESACGQVCKCLQHFYPSYGGWRSSNKNVFEVTGTNNDITDNRNRFYAHTHS